MYWIIPVALSILLGPGVGQLYNREYKKGVVMILAGLGLLLTFSIWLTKAALPYLPADITQLDRKHLTDIIQTHVIHAHPFTFHTYQGLLLGLYLFGTIDAFYGARRKRIAPRGTPPNL